MSKKLGPIAYGEDEENVFIGREITSHRNDYSDETAREIDREVRLLVDEQYALANRLLTENRDKLDRLAEALLERETLDSPEINAAMEGRELPPNQRVIIPTYSEKQKNRAEKKRPASIFGAPKPATS